MKKLVYLVYGTLCYAIFFATFLYLIGFVENAGQFAFGEKLAPLFTKSLDMGTSPATMVQAVLINLALIALFGIQHSVMARPAFKKRWTRIIPQPIERSTYVLFASVALIVLFIFWQPIKNNIWDMRHTLTGDIFLYISLSGWFLLLISTFMINHFDLFGLRQVYLYAKNNMERNNLPFQTPGIYKLVRHPIYLSFLIAFWFTPVMTLGHLIFSMGMTVYIFIGIYHEEKDLIRQYGQLYRNYREQVPKIIPLVKGIVSGKDT